MKWGSIKWGQARWGGTFALDENGQGWHDLDEPGVRYIGASDGQASPFSDFATDRSDIGLSLSGSPPTATTLALESAYGRTAAFAVDIDTSDTGRLVTFQGTSGDDYIEIGSGRAQLVVGGTTVFSSIDLPNASSTARRYVVAWICEGNPGTTGASDACISTLVLHDCTTGDTTIERAAHKALEVHGAARNIDLFCDGGATIFSGKAYQAVLSVRPWSTREAVEKLSGASIKTALDSARVVRHVYPDYPSGFANPGHFAGPELSLPAWDNRRVRHTWHTAVLTEVHDQPTDWTDYTPQQRWITAPGTNANGVRIYLGYLRWVALPRTANRLSMRLHVTTTEVLGSGKPWYRLISMDRLPSLNQIVLQNEPSFEQSWAEVEASVTPAAGGAPEVVAIDDVPIRWDEDGLGTYVALAFTIPTGVVVRIDSWSVGCYHIETDDGFPVILPP